MSFSQITIGVDVLVFVSVYVLHRSSSFLVHLIYIVKHFAIVSVVPPVLNIRDNWVNISLCI
jgi:hypothetical protein